MRKINWPVVAVAIVATCVTIIIHWSLGILIAAVCGWYHNAWFGKLYGDE